MLLLAMVVVVVVVELARREKVDLMKFVMSIRIL